MSSTSWSNGYSDFYRPCARPSSDLDSMIHDVSNRTARAQLARQISSSTSTSFQRRAARILKANSAGNSPQHIQRRRTTTSHTMRQHLSDLYGMNVQRQSQHMPSVDYTPGHMDSKRPMSWHPSTMICNRPASSSYSTREAMGGVHTTAIHGLPTPMTQPYIDSLLPVDPTFNLDDNANFQQTFIPPSGEHTPFNNYQNQIYPLDETFYPVNQIQYTNVPSSHGYTMSPLMGYSTQAWSYIPFTAHADTAPPTPDFLPIQHPPDLCPKREDSSEISVRGKKSKELVGMGLYDKPDRGTLSMLGAAEGTLSGHAPNTGHESMGKGLKLEETWQPPHDKTEEEEAEQEEEEDVYSSEDGEEELPTSFGQGGYQTSVRSAHADLSDQSFFLDSEDTPFDGMIYDQGVSGINSKALGAGLGNFGWI